MKLLVSISFIIASLGFSFGQQNRVALNGVVAQIGDNVVLQSDIEAQVLQAQQAGLTISPDFRCTVLEGIMYQNLLINQAKLDSLEVTDQQVDAEMENRIRAIEAQIGSREKMEQFYGKTISQIKEEFREVIRQRMLADEMERTITENITITPREVKEFFESLPADSIPFINSQTMFQQIVLYPDITKSDKLRARTELEDILKQAREGKNFGTLARLYSDDRGSASKGGEISARRGMMVAPFEAAVFSLKEGEISEVFESEYGYHIVKLISRKGDNYVCAHVLKIPTYTSEELEKAALRLDTCYRLLKANEITWEDAVKRFSNDEATMQNKGIISNPYTGEQKWDAADLSEIDQQIYLLTDRLSVGQITEPNLYEDMMTRKEGVRILRLAQRTEPHKANIKEDYPLIQKAAESVKHQKMIDDWMKSKIQQAYVRVNDEYKDCQFKYDWLIK
ncbi:MAG: peptidylprolyl isomerase [Crocinitomicaceae bacterium]|nr:peptidylprolyl isomerase [Crocinitomicaceae bacterium]